MIVKSYKELTTHLLNSERVVINCKNMVMGRLLSAVAKAMMKNPKVVVFLANKDLLLIKGSIDFVVKDENKKLVLAHKHRGPFYSKRANSRIREKFRNMLPYKNKPGKSAYLRFITWKYPTDVEPVSLETVALSHAFTYKELIVKLNGGRYVI